VTVSGDSRGPFALRVVPYRPMDGTWNVRMKSRSQISDLVDQVTRHVKWHILSMQEAAMEPDNVSDSISGGHCVYIAKAPARGRSVAIVVHADLARLATNVVDGERYMYIGFSFKTEEARIPTMRVGSCHLPPEGGHHTSEEFSSILQNVEHAMQLGHRAVQIWCCDANVHLGRRHDGDGVGRKIEDQSDPCPGRATEFCELLGAVGLRALNTFRDWDMMQDGGAAAPTTIGTARSLAYESSAPWTTSAWTARPGLSLAPRSIFQLRSHPSLRTMPGWAFV